MRLRHVYLVLCIVGVLLPYSQFIPWLLQHGLDLPLFSRELFANQIGGFFGLDVIVSSFVLWILVFVEGRRVGVRQLWLPVVASLVVVCLAVCPFSFICANFTLMPLQASKDISSRR